MKILLTNDDGIGAEGIAALYEALRKEHTVFMFAPDGQRSACSNALTLHDLIRVDRVDENRFAVYGYPADCVNVGLHSSFVGKVDLVVSGINHGPNLADDIYYSGTVAAARTAHIFGISGIAVSLNSCGENNGAYFADCADFVVDFIAETDLLKRGKASFININYPPLEKKEIAGVSYTSLGKRHYEDEYIIERQEGSSIFMRLDGTIRSENRPHTDVTEMDNGYITVTPLKLDTTDYALLEECREKGLRL